jgi:hypothetical protein
LCSTAPDGFICHSHAGDDWRECRDYVREKLGLRGWEPGDNREQHRTIGPDEVAKWDLAAINSEVEDRARSEDDLRRIARAQELWNEAGDPRGTAAEQYLNARALNLSEDLAGAVLRFHHRTPWRNENSGRTDFIPCLIACFRSIDDDQIVAVHRIRVDQPQRWPKTQRRMFGPTYRAAVKLAPAGDELLIAEGVESAMAAMTLGFGVAWALGSAGAIARFPVIDGVQRLSIHAEPGQASATAVEMCRARWRQASRKTAVVRSTIGSDLNDALMAQRRAAE